MKTWTLILTLSLVKMVYSPLGAPATDGDVESAGREFVDLLAKQDFPSACAQFDATMKGALPEAKLRETWQTLQKQAGRFQKQLQTRTGKQQEYDVVLVTCQFEKMLLDAKVVFDDERHIAGLFFVPSQATTGSKALPAYVKTNAFREQAVQVGSGEWMLPGTLTLPVVAGRPCPAVVLVHGSGPNDRDETVGANQPFRDLAWGLATKGIAVLRYEKRTKQHGRKLVGKPITVKEETIDDALLAISQLRKTDGIDARAVFVLGHSLGGLLAPRIGQADPAIAGLIILAGPTRPLEDLMVEQTRYILSLEGKISAEGEAMLAQVQSGAAAVKKLTPADASSQKLILSAPAGYWLDLHQYNPIATAKAIKQPMLILQGQRDYQVTRADFDGWRTALIPASRVTFQLYPKLNHLFMTGDSKSAPAEYQLPGYVAEVVIADIAGWITSHMGQMKSGG